MDLEACRLVIRNTFSSNGGLELLQSVVNTEPQDNPTQPSNLPGWCICGRCRSMPTPAENVCCRKRPCITTLEFFQSAVLDMNVLSIAIVNRSDMFADDPDYSPSGYRKAAYRQWVLWNHGYLGRANRRVIPSCCVWAVRNKYPSPGGHYLGFKEY